MRCPVADAELKSPPWQKRWMPKAWSERSGIRFNRGVLSSVVRSLDVNEGGTQCHRCLFGPQDTVAAA